MLKLAVDDMNIDVLVSLLEQVEMTTPVVAKNFPKIVDKEGDCLLRENQ